MEYITIECMRIMPHEKHSWREGFLWLTKKTCGGMTQAFYDKRYQTHRHHYRFAPVHSDQILMIWRCKKPGCRESYTCFRSLFNYQTRVRTVLADGYSVVYKKQKI